MKYKIESSECLYLIGNINEMITATKYKNK